jgi:hypothetical protein
MHVLCQTFLFDVLGRSLKHKCATRTFWHRKGSILFVFVEVEVKGRHYANFLTSLPAKACTSFSVISSRNALFDTFSK